MGIDFIDTNAIIDSAYQSDSYSIPLLIPGQFSVLGLCYVSCYYDIGYLSSVVDVLLGLEAVALMHRV